MAGRPLATPASTTPVVTVEEQATITPTPDEIAKAVEAAKEAEAAKAAEAAKVAADATPDADEAKAIAEAKAAEVAKVSATVAKAKTAAAVEVIGTEAGKTGKPAKGKPRIEKFEATKPNGTVVIVERNIDTGEQSVTEK